MRTALMKSFYIILLFTLTLMFRVDSQTNPALKSFTNYGSCYQGLKSAKGKVVWPADFESLKQIWDNNYTTYPRHYFWVAEKNGSFGLIDPSGKLIIPFNYSRFAAYPNGIIAADDSAAYLFSSTGEMTLKLSGYSWIRPTSKGYIIEREGKFGFTGFRLNEILSTDYDQISFCQIQRRGEAYKEIVSNRFLRIEKDEEKGIFDLIQNKWIIPWTTDYIYANWIVSCQESDAIFHLSNNDSPETRIINSSGIQILQYNHPRYSRLELTPLDSCGTKSHQFAYIEENSKMKILNLKTGKYSNEHLEIYPAHGYSIFFDKKNWGVIDTGFVELKQIAYPRYNQDWLSDMLESPQISIAQERASILFNQYYNDRIDSVLITRKEIKPTKKDDNERERFGLVNFRTGKRIKAKYQQIEIWKQDNQTLYWAFNYTDESHSYTSDLLNLDIYNSDLQLLNKLENGLDLEFSYHDAKKKGVIIESNEKWGVIAHNGEQIIPIIYQNCKRFTFPTDKTYSSYYSIFFVEKEMLSGVIDDKGKLIIPIKYKRLVYNDGLIQALREDGLFDIFDTHGNNIIQGIASWNFQARTDEFGKCISEKGKSSFTPMTCVYFTKDDDLYSYFNGKLEVLDETFFNFTENYCYFHQWILIDQKGKILSHKPSGISKFYVSYQRDYPSECSKYVDEYPVPIRKTKQRTDPDLSKQFTWKQHDTKKPNEWFLYDGYGEILYSEPFEYPLKETDFHGGAFKQNGKFGFFDSDYTQYLSAEFDYLYPMGPLTYKDGFWRVHDKNSNRVSEEFDHVTLNKKNKLRFVFKDGQIGLLNDSLDLEVPLTDSAEFLKKYDLVKLLNYSGHYNYKKRHSVHDIIFLGEPKELYRTINNYHILEKAYYNSTENELLKYSHIDKRRQNLPSGLKNLEFYHNPTSTRIQRRPKYYNKNFYCEMTLTWELRWSSDRSSFGRLEDRYKNRKLFNYKIVGNNLVKIDLDDIIKTDPASVAKLNKLLTEELTRIQAFGDNCTDLESKLEQLKSNFLIEGYRIVFYWGDRGGFQVEIVFNDLKDILRYPKKMLVR